MAKNIARELSLHNIGRDEDGGVMFQILDPDARVYCAGECWMDDDGIVHVPAGEVIDLRREE